MKLKEAQMLGILALIAVGIVLLCMWGGGDDLAQKSEGDGAAVALGASPADTEDLYRELLGQPGGMAAEVGDREATEMSVGLGELPPMQTSEEAMVQDTIERTAPAEIGLMAPPQPEKQDAAAPVRQVVIARPTLPPQPIIHVVQSGDTLSEISTKYYGTVKKVKVITDANPGLDPRRMPVGTRLKIPRIEGLREAVVVASSGPAPALSAVAGRRPGAPVRKYTVQKGDSLYRIALKFYNDGNKLEDIRLANRDVLPNPDYLRVGMELVIP
jgi:nucleoid-associated protein YgaU